MSLGDGDLVHRPHRIPSHMEMVLSPIRIAPLVVGYPVVSRRLALLYWMAGKRSCEYRVVSIAVGQAESVRRQIGRDIMGESGNPMTTTPTGKCASSFVVVASDLPALLVAWLVEVVLVWGGYCITRDAQIACSR